MKECCQCGHKAEVGFVTFCDKCYDNQEESQQIKHFPISNKIAEEAISIQGKKVIANKDGYFHINLTSKALSFSKTIQVKKVKK